MNQNNIKPQELRIGNWVQYDNRYFQIDSIAEVFPTLNTDEFGIGVVDYNNIQPIPLSEEVLLKCGFSKQESTIYINKGFIEIGTIANGKRFYIQCGVQNSTLPIQYLHQLQNLFYSLTGKELTINF